MASIASELTRRGHELHIVTSLPWYRLHDIEPGWNGQLVRHERTEWGCITRVHPFPTDKANLPARAMAFGGFTVLAAIEGLVGHGRPDAVLSMSPPLTLGAAGWSVAQWYRVPFVFNIQDVFPDVAVELGLLTNRGAIAASKWLERVTYRHADAVTVLSEDLADNVRAKLATASRSASTASTRVVVIPNFIDTDWIRPGERENAYRREHGLEGKRVVMYAGNVGLSQSLDLLVDAASALSGEADTVFVINGGGAARPALERRAAGMPNVRFVGMQPKARLPEVLAAADVQVVPLKRGLARASVPSKLYSILAAARPLVASVDPGTEVDRAVRQAGAGLTVPPDEPVAFTAAIRQLLGAPAEAEGMGAAGRRWVEAWLSPAAVAEQYESLFDELIAERASHQSPVRLGAHRPSE